MSKDYNTRFNTMLKYLGITRKDVARITGLGYKSVGNRTRNGDFSNWAKLAVWVFENTVTQNEWVHLSTSRTDGILKICTQEKINGKWFDVIKTEVKPKDNE